MKPGTSARNSSGMLNALQVWMKRAALSEESTNRTPPLTLGWLATTPITRPSSRAYPTISSLAQRAWISRNEPPSTTPSISRCMSNGLFSSAGIRSAIGVCSTGAGPGFGLGGGESANDDGK